MTMLRTVPTLLALLTGLVVATTLPRTAWAEQVVTLREIVEVDGDFVLFGDLFEDAGSAASQAVFRSPEPGASGIVSADRLVRAALKHGLVWENAGRAATVTIARPGIEITLDEISDAITTELHARATQADPQVSYAIEFAAGSSSFFINTSAEGVLDVTQLRFNERSGRFSASVSVSEGSAGTTRRTFSGRAVAVRTLPVIIRPVSRGETIEAADVEMRDVPLRRIPSDALLETGALVGMAARRSLRADQPLRGRDVQLPQLVKRNAVVVASYEVPGLTITVRARALGDAAMGETVRVLNLQSNRIIEARVIGENTVQAMPTGLAVTVATN